MQFFSLSRVYKTERGLITHKNIKNRIPLFPPLTQVEAMVVSKGSHLVDTFVDKEGELEAVISETIFIHAAIY